jgi:hypothetical protein
LLPAFFAIAPREIVGAAAGLETTPNATMAIAGRGSQSPPAPSPPAPVPVGGFSPEAGSSSGFAFSVFLTLAGLLVLGAPWARRRMRLASEPWPTAPFVLMPERPG